MRGHQLREILNDIRNAVGASGGSKHAEVIDQLQSALTDLDNAAIPDLVGQVEAAVAALSQEPWEAKLKQLQQAGLSEPDFCRALDEIRSDKAVKKSDRIKIAEAYVGYAEKKASSDKLVDAIKTRFYGKIYDRDANEMAKRATPW